MTCDRTAPVGRVARILTALTVALVAGCSSEPTHCIHYDAARVALKEANALEVRYGPDVDSWPTDATDDLDNLSDWYIEAASRMWANAPTDSAWARQQPTLDDILNPAWFARGEETCE